MYWVAYQFEDPLSLVISMSKLVQIILRVKPLWLGGVGFNNYSSQLNCKKKKKTKRRRNRKKERFDVGNVFRKIGILLC